MKTYKFTRIRGAAITLSTLLILGFWTGTFLQGGFNFGIDFKAGLNLTVELEGSPGITEVKEALAGIGSYQVQTLGDDQRLFSIRVAEDASVADFRQTISKEIQDRLKESLGSDVIIQNEEYVGARFAGNLAAQTILLVGIALALILIYIWIRFHLNYAVSAIAAIFHDVFFLTGFIGIFQLEFTTATIAAVLTIIGYSLNDTIVIFDRIRENSRAARDETFQETIDHSISQSLSRTLITSITTLFAVLAIFIFGIGTIKTFALSLIVGVIVGTYSSIFIASPILLAWHNGDVRRAAKKKKTASSGARTETSPPQGDAKVLKFQSSPPEEAPVSQTAEEIAEATARRIKAKAAKKKKKKK